MGADRRLLGRRRRFGANAVLSGGGNRRQKRLRHIAWCNRRRTCLRQNNAQRFLVGIDLGFGVHDIDGVTVLIAKAAHVDLGEKIEPHDRGTIADLRLDRADCSRQRGEHVAKIEIDRRVKSQRQFFCRATAGHRNLIGDGEHITRKRWLRRDVDTNRRNFSQRRESMRALQRHFGVPRAPRQIVDDILRQARRQPLPGIGQQVDIVLLADRHRIDGNLAGKREPHCHAVRVAPRCADITGRLCG